MCYNAIKVKGDMKLYNIILMCGDYINTGKIFESEKYSKNSYLVQMEDIL